MNNYSINKIMRIIQIACISFCFCLTAFGQDSLTVVLQAHPEKESIRLRWVVNKPYQWEKSLKFGYMIERYTVKRNGVLLPEREKKILTPEPIKAAPLDAWEHIAQQNNYGAVLAQALYGSSFEVTGPQSGDIMSIVNLSEEREQRFSFALSAADMCFECACLAGWGYEDKETVKGEYYLYRVIPVGENTANWNIEFGFAYTSTDEYHELPKPVGLTAEFGDLSVRLQWNNSLFNRSFCAWQIEKSENNKQFEPVGMPVTSWSDSSSDMMLVDSLTANNKTYYYRVRGISIFGGISPPSDTVSGKGTEAIKSNPVITRSVINTQGHMEIEWTFDEAAQHLIRSFELQRSSTGSGVFRPVKTNIPADTRFLTYEGPLEASNYFIIAANPVNGEKAIPSFPVLVQPIDSFPPAAPRNLTAKADTLGRVFLKWDANTESDLLGYKIYRGNVAGEELIPLTNDTISAVQYVDTIDLKNLNSQVYYAIKAFDTHYNQSPLSEIIAVEKPLKVKPSQPIFNDYKVQSDGIFLSWVQSPSSEVAFHTLYRAQSDSMKYRPVMIFKLDSIHSFLDKSIENGVNYTYAITATSRWNVESDYSPLLQVTASPSTQPVAFTQLKGISDKENKLIKVTWRPTDLKKVKSWMIYRAENDDPISFWRSLPAGNTSTDDTNILKTGNTYHYLIYAIMIDGGNSKSEKLTVIY